MTKVGIKDVAAKARVSIATVSHAFRNPGRVSKNTRKRVLAAAEEIGYSPNALARSLRTSRSGNIVAIIPDVSDSYNSELIKAIEKVAHGRGYSVLLGDTQGSEQRERDFAAMARSGQADGIILMSHRLPFKVDEGHLSIDELPPLVNGCESTGIDEFPTVSIDDVAGAIDATNHLLGLGHRDIAVITGDIDSSSCQKRLEGFHKSMQDAGVRVDEQSIAYGGYTANDGETATTELLTRKRRPTAILCFSDEIALGCLYVLRQRGFDVPRDISVMGFDNIPFAKYFVPPLTTIAQPAEEIGATCATLLLDLIDGKKPEKNRHILAHELLIRESTGPLARN